LPRVADLDATALLVVPRPVEALGVVPVLVEAVPVVAVLVVAVLVVPLAVEPVLVQAVAAEALTVEAVLVEAVLVVPAPVVVARGVPLPEPAVPDALSDVPDLAKMYLSNRVPPTYPAVVPTAAPKGRRRARRSRLR